MLDSLFDLLDKGMQNFGGWAYPIYVIFLAVGVFFLVKFCDIFVDSASAIAKKLKISPLIIGLTVVAIGTSCPELAVSVSNAITALKEGTTAEIAIGNVVGSNICNILLVLGFSCLFTPIVVRKSICKKELPILLGISTILTLACCFFSFSNNGVSYPFGITRWEGIILAVLCVLYLVYIVFNAKKNPDEADEEEEVKDMAIWKAIILVIVGAVGIALGGEFVVYGARSIAVNVAVAAGLDRGMVEALVGLTIVAVGTSLPELVTSIVAARKGQNELALGNVIGSNIFNTVFVLGISATINPLGTTNNQMFIEALFMLGITGLLFGLSLKNGKLGKKTGMTFIGLYVLFLVYLILRTVLVK